MEPRIVLFVDDDPEILKVLRRMVRGDGLTVLTATGPEHAFEILKGVEIPVVADAFLAMAEREGEGESFLRRDAKFDLAAFLEA